MEKADPLCLDVQSSLESLARCGDPITSDAIRECLDAWLDLARRRATPLEHDLQELVGHLQRIRTRTLDGAQPAAEYRARGLATLRCLLGCEPDDWNQIGGGELLRRWRSELTSRQVVGTARAALRDWCEKFRAAQEGIFRVAMGLEDGVAVAL